MLDIDKSNTIFGYFRVACLKNNVKKPAIVALIDMLEQNKDVLFYTGKENKGIRILSVLENDQKFEVFVDRFF